jgi:ABC-type glycerol-3-phosphate transport system substrate-binding protein
MGRFRLRWTGALLSVIAAATLAACGGNDDGGGSSGSRELTVVLPAARPESDFIKKNLPAFERANKAKVKVLEVPYGNLHTKLATEFLGGGKAYDVIGMPYEWIPAFAEYLAPLSGKLTDADREDILPAALQAVEFEGEVYGSLYALTTQVLFYRTDLLEQAGLTPPTDWDSYVSAAEKLTKPPVFGTIVTAANNPEPVGMFLDYLYQAGGDVVDDSGKVTVADAAGVEALTFMADQVSKYKVAPPGAANYTTAETTTLFTEGKLGMAPNWVYMYAIAEGDDSQVKGKVGVAPLPEGKSGGATIGGWTLSLASSSENQELGEKLLRFMSDSKRQAQMATQYGNVPTRQSAADLPEVQKLGFVKPAFDTLAHGVPRVKSKAWPEMETALAEAISAALSKQSSPQEALDTAAGKIQSALDDSKDG